ncbi:MAG: 4-phosphoerythronate dehydrogenase [Duncaniella sp.]|nr:4-phosphoerythronate dehydrogenase [Duncaniella sp.]
MKIAIEKHVPFIKGVFEPVAEVVYLAPDEFTPAAVADVDAIVTRPRTRCDAALLDGSRCRFIGTATIGTDHIDLDYCRRRGIEVVNAPGCNAPAVAQWVFAAIKAISARRYEDMTLGIVGVGHVGRIVEAWGRSLGMRVLLNDPPRAAREGNGAFVPLETIAAESDVITFHTPLTRDGEWPTYHLCDEKFVVSLKRRPVILNAARGPITATVDLVNGLDSGFIGGLGIDCWEGEPSIDLDLLNRAKVATPHIAGYSIQGKIRATAMVVDALSRHFGVTPAPLTVDVPGPAPLAVSAADITYDILADTSLLRAAVPSLPASFEQLRNNYCLRQEVLAVV